MYSGDIILLPKPSLMLQDQKIKSFADTIFTLDIFLYYCWRGGGVYYRIFIFKGTVQPDWFLHENGTIR